MSFDIIANWENRSILDSKSLLEIVELIRKPSDEHKECVKLARLLGKSHPLYRKLKSEMPCFIPNFRFSNGYVKGSNVSESTGYLYIDVDNNLNVNLDSPYIVSYWKSISGLGYSILVSVSGITKENFKNATIDISKELYLPVDTATLTIDRNCVISYDEYAYYNSSYETIKYTGLSKAVISNNNTLRDRTSFNSLKDKKSLVTNTKSIIVESTEFNGEIMVDLGSKVGYATVGNVNIKIPDGKRNTSLFFMGCQLKVLNTWLDYNRFYKYMVVVNNNGCNTPLSAKELKIICNNVFKKFKDGSLKIVNNNTCRFLFNPDYDLTPKQKRSYMMKYINNKITEKNMEKVRKYINLTSCTNNSKIARDCSLSRPTVIKYKKELGLEGNN